MTERVDLGILFIAALLAAPAHAETVTVCYNYGCETQAEVRFEDAELAGLRQLLSVAPDADAERLVIARVIGKMYAIAGRQSPLWRDRGGNYPYDDNADGRMDCIDNAANTTRFLLLLESRSLLGFHSVEEPVRRGIFAAHWGARIRDRASAEEFIVDSWFFDKDGGPVAVFTFDLWRRGATANGH